MPLVIVVATVIVFGVSSLTASKTSCPTSAVKPAPSTSSPPGCVRAPTNAARIKSSTTDSATTSSRPDRRSEDAVHRSQHPARLGEGKPFILHKDAPGTDEPKRNAVCGRFTAQLPKGSCDEYAFASSKEGGRSENVRIEEVPLREQNCQGGTLRQEYRRAQIAEGDAFTVVITNPDKIADKPYWGVDIAKEQACGS